MYKVAHCGINKLPQISNKSLILIFFWFFVLQSNLTALASDTSDQCQIEKDSCIEIGEWNFGVSFGLGGRSNPLVDGSDIPFIVLPSFSYYGENFFINNLDVGYTLHETNRSSFSLISTPSYDRVFFERWALNNIIIEQFGAGTSLPPDLGGEGSSDSNEVSSAILEDKDISWLAGFEYYYQHGNSQYQISVLSDITDVHGGTEVRAAWAQKLSQEWSTTLGFTWKDSDLTDYYYGVNQQNTTETDIYYKASSSVNPFIRISWLQSLEQDANAQDSRWRFSLELQQLANSISESPVVTEELVVSVFFGKQFQF